MKIEINTTVVSPKFGKGIITKIITKSTGYVEVNYNGNFKKEMAFNLTDENGVSLKSAPKKSVITEQDKIDNAKDFARINARLNNALSNEIGRNGSNEFLLSIR